MNIYFKRTYFYLNEYRARARMHAYTSSIRFRDRVLTSFPPEFKILVEQERTGGGAIDRRCLPTRERERIYDPIRLFSFSPPPEFAD